MISVSTTVPLSIGSGTLMPSERWMLTALRSSTFITASSIGLSCP